MYPIRFQISKFEKQIPNLWDVVAFIIIFGIIVALAWGASQMTLPYKVGQPLEISLSPSMLPEYAIRTVLRMFIALGFSLLFTLTVAPLAAKSRQAEKLIIPMIDILQSIPILGMLSITIVGFIALFPNKILGPECAAIFAIFTSQVWNMVLSFYQSLKTVPSEYYQTARVFHLSPWQTFIRIELPNAIPSLLWNTMLSMSAGWFFVVASEAIAVSNQNIMLPGIGSYISKAIIDENLLAIFYAICTMLVVILIYDQLLFRPLLVWTGRYKPLSEEELSSQQSWFYELLTKTRLLKKLKLGFQSAYDLLISLCKSLCKSNQNRTTPSWFQLNEQAFSKFITPLWNIFLIIAAAASLFMLWQYITKEVSRSEIGKVFYFGAITAIKVFVLIILTTLIWFPVGVWIGQRPRVTQFFQPLIQFIAAFPANLFYPIVFLLIVHFKLNVDVWTAPLMILGTQWYILFNVIAGAANIPKELYFATQNFGVKRSLLWKRLIIPAIFPYYITGALTAAGGSWNASIVSEVLQWGDQKLIATGLGSYIAQNTADGDFPRIALGIGVMSIYVILFNRLLWDRLYKLATNRFTLD